MPEEVVVTDEPEEVYDLATAQQFDKAFELDENHAGDLEVRTRAEKVVNACLSQGESFFQTHVGAWRQYDDLYRQESLSAPARDFGTHMGGPLRAIEEFASKMKSAIFGQESFITGTSEQYDDDEKASLAAALVEEQARTELRLVDRSLPHFREAGIFGTKIGKLVPKRDIQYVFHREVEAVEYEGTTKYRFHKPEEKEIASTRLDLRDVTVFDFRIAETAKSIEDAGWCGDYSYPTEDEVRVAVERKEFDRAAVEDLFQRVRTTDEGDTGNLFNASGPYRYQTENSRLQGEGPDAGPHILQFAQFEWWGDFDIEGNDRNVPCVITLLLPARDNAPIIGHAGLQGVAVQIRRNPLYHQRKPYLAHRVVCRENEFWGIGIIEMVSKHSHYEDELAALGLMGAYLESSPPLEVGLDSGLEYSDLDGFLPGKPLFVEQPGHLKWLESPRGSSTALQVSEYFSQRAQDTAGVGRPRTRPRVAAAGVVADTQEDDIRLFSYIDAYENDWLKNLAEQADGLNQQFMTEERKIKVLGAEGLKTPDIRTVTPTDILIGKRFEPTVGRKLAQKAFQTQQLINLWDRLMQWNIMEAQMGKGEPVDMGSVMKRILRDGFGITDVHTLLRETTDPADLRAANEEHRLYAMGEFPSPQRGENTVVHLQSHLEFFRSGEMGEWSAPKVRAFTDHIWDTIDALYREVEKAMPGAEEMVRQFILPQIMGMPGPTSGARGYASQGNGDGALGGEAGGRGVASATQGMESPLLRRQTQSDTMGMTANMGAQ